LSIIDTFLCVKTINQKKNEVLSLQRLSSFTREQIIHAQSFMMIAHFQQAGSFNQLAG